MTTIFLDTTTLMHAKPLGDIPWEKREQPPITIVITRAVIRELDKHKDQHPRKYLRERAVKALQRIEAATEQPRIRHDVTLTIRYEHPRINWQEYELDENSTDDQLLATLVEYRHERPTETIVLYTHDVGPRLTAQHLGITTKPIPEEVELPRFRGHLKSVEGVHESGATPQRPDRVGGRWPSVSSALNLT